MKMKKIALVLVLFILLAAIPAHASLVGPYYISNNPKATGSTCANGSDSNSGLTTLAPFATWQQAANTISSGNYAIIYACGGMVGGSFGGGIIAGGKDGQDSTHPIRTTSLTGERATFNAVAGRGEDTVHHWASGDATDYGLFSVTGDSDFWQFDNLNFTNTHASIPTIKALNLDNTTDQTTYRTYINTAGIFGNIIKFAVGADYFTFDSLTVTDILFAGAGDTAIDHMTLTNSTFDDGNLNYGYHSYLSGANWSVHNNTFSNYSSYVFHINHCGGSEATDFNGGSIYNNLFSNIATKPYWQVLDGLWIHGGAALYICPLGSNNLVYNNLFYKVNYGLSIPPDGTGVALKLTNLLAQSGNVAANNTFQYGYCDVFIYMQGGNTYANNLTGTTTIQHSASPAACSVDDYVTKQTNLTNVNINSFTNAAAGDLTLAAGATAISAGTTVASVPSDYTGATRSAPYDVGAYLYNAAPPSTLPFDSFNYTLTSQLETNNGGTGWSAAWLKAGVDNGVVTAAPASGPPGSNSVKYTAAGAGFNGQHTRVFASNLVASSSPVSVYVYTSLCTATGDLRGFFLEDSVTGTGVMVLRLAGGQIQLYDNGTAGYQNIAACAINTWYKIEVDFDDINHPNQYRARVNGGAYTSYYTVFGGSFTSINRIRLYDVTDDAHSIYFAGIGETGALPDYLEFTTQPSNTVSGNVISPAVVATVRLAAGTTDTASTASVTFTISACGAALSGTTTVAAVAGVVTAPSIIANTAATGCTLTAAATSITTAVSNTFNVTAIPTSTSSGSFGVGRTGRLQ